jgi:hypothetical protein
MTNSTQQWLTSRAAPPGMLACGVRGPDGTFVCHSVEASCPEGTLEKILRQFDAARATLFSDDLAPSWSTWAFERGQIRFVERPDGWLLGLLIRTDTEAQRRLDPLSTEFLSLELAPDAG